MPAASFENAPLVEIVAELRWTPSDVAPAAQQPGALAITVAHSMPPSLDQLFNSFLGQIYQSDFHQVERLVPSGFPVVLHHPAFRFRKDQQHPALFQLGLGLFSANGLQPYRSWAEFRPVVELGVGILLSARIAADQALPFSLHSLRYINAFGPDLLNGQTIPKFITDTLGFSLQLPDPVANLIDDPTNVKSHSQLVIPIKDSQKSMSLSFGEGVMPNAPTTPAVLMEMTITQQSVAPTAATIMNAFDTSRAIIHDTFFNMTEEIHALMKPLQAN